MKSEGNPGFPTTLSGDAGKKGSVKKVSPKQNLSSQEASTFSKGGKVKPGKKRS